MLVPAPGCLRMKALYDSIVFIGGGAGLIGGTLGLILGLELHKVAETAQKSLSCTKLHDCPPELPEVLVFAALGALPGALFAIYNLVKRSNSISG